jgi:lipoprotein NlpD
LKQQIFRTGLHDTVSRRSGRLLHHCLLLGMAGLLAGCTASWQAPVESRGTGRPPAKTVTRAAERPGPIVPRQSIRGGEYRVKRGDTLHGIAWQSGIDHRSIARWNGLRPPYRIYAGQTLRLRPPTATRKPPPPQPVSKTSKPASKTTRPVQKTPPRERRSESKAVSRDLRWSWPVQGKVVSRFKAADPLRSGIKIAGSQGKQILSAESGKVVYSGSGLIGYGRLIIVKHNDKYLSAYGHNRKILVAEGEQVTKGQKIAEMGTSNSGAPVLHFEIRRDGKPVDPLRLLPRR